MELSKKMVGWMDHLPLLVVVVVVEVLSNLHRHSLYREPWKIKNKIKLWNYSPTTWTYADPEVRHSNTEEVILYFIRRKDNIYSKLVFFFFLFFFCCMFRFAASRPVDCLTASNTVNTRRFYLQPFRAKVFLSDLIVADVTDTLKREQVRWLFELHFQCSTNAYTD